MSEKKLYRIDWSGSCFIMAESDLDAVAEAENLFLDYSYDEVGIEASATQVEKKFDAAGVVNSNHDHYLVFNDEGDIPLSQRIEEAIKNECE